MRRDANGLHCNKRTIDAQELSKYDACRLVNETSNRLHTDLAGTATPLCLTSAGVNVPCKINVNTCLTARTSRLQTAATQDKELLGHGVCQHTLQMTILRDQMFKTSIIYLTTRGSAIAEEPRDALRQLKYYGRFFG